MVSAATAAVANQWRVVIAFSIRSSARTATASGALPRPAVTDESDRLPDHDAAAPAVSGSATGRAAGR